MLLIYKKYKNILSKIIVPFFIFIFITNNVCSTEVNVKSMSGLSENNTLFVYDFYTEILKFNPAYAVKFKDNATICFPDLVSFEYEKNKSEKKVVNNSFNPFVMFSYKNIVGGTKLDSFFSNIKNDDLSENDCFFWRNISISFFIEK